MDLNSSIGSTVLFLGTGGFDRDREEAFKYLTVGTPYTVRAVDVGGWVSYVYLDQFPNIPFNTVMFENFAPSTTKESPYQKEFGWLGEVHGIQDVMLYKIVKVFHNKISNRKEDSYGFHIVLPNGKAYDEYYPNSTFALLAIACLDSGQSTDHVHYMAKVAGIKVGE